MEFARQGCLHGELKTTIFEYFASELLARTDKILLKTALYRLRKLIGNKTVLYQNGLLTLNSACCWLDAWAFEDICAIKDPETALAKKAVGLYKGHFLPAEQDEPWAISARERLKLKFLRLINRMGSCYEEHGYLDEAVEAYQRGLELEQAHEDFCRRLMLCNQRLGRRSEAIVAYNRCCATLKNIMDIGPSPETEAVYKALLRS